MTVLTVGTGEEFATLSAAVGASHDGDVIKVNAGTYVNDFSEITTKVTIEGVGGLASFIATTPPGNGKGILVTDTDITLENIELSGSTSGDENGAGIRYQGGNLTLINDYVHDNQNGILGSPAVAGTGTVTIQNSEFASNGAGDGYSHNIYLGNIAELTVTGSYIHNANVGHEIKSRALATDIENNRIQDNSTGTASYDIDTPNGGAVTIKNNVIEKGPDAQNPSFVAFGEEGNVIAGSTLQVSGNTFVNDLGRGAAGVWDATASDPATISGNSFWNFASSSVVNGPATVSNDAMSSSRPSLDVSSTLQAGNALSAGHLAVLLSEDAWNGDAFTTVSVDGKLTFEGSITQLHNLGQDATIDLGAFDLTQAHTISVAFTNDAYGGSSATDRNLYVDNVLESGSSMGIYDPIMSTGSVEIGTPVAATNNAPVAGAAANLSVGSGSDTFVLGVSEDAWKGNAQFTVSVDGTQIGGVQTATAQHGTADQQVSVSGNFGAGSHDLQVTFLNDAYGGSASMDRNLYVDSLSYDGTQTTDSAALYSDGTANLLVNPGAPLVQSVGSGSQTVKVVAAEDAWMGDAQFTATVDGKSFGAPLTVSALQSFGQTETFDLSGSFGVGTHDIQIAFINDLYGGTPQTDRNLYVESVSLGGQAASGGTVALFSNGIADFHIAAPSNS